jgi:polyisoprenoid-binding protein YceI
MIAEYSCECNRCTCKKAENRPVREEIDMANQAAVRKEQGYAFPAPGTWEIDASHSNVGFVARHLMISKVRGNFQKVSGELTIGETPEASSVTATIDAASIDTADEMRDGHLRSPDFLDVEKYPTLEFRSTYARQLDEANGRLQGELRIRDVTRPVSLDVSYLGLVTDPFGNEKAVFSAETEIDREEFGITWNKALETGGVLVGRRVKVELEIQAVRKG